MQVLNNLSQLKGLFTQLDFKETQTRKQAEAERIKREIMVLESQPNRINPIELSKAPVPTNLIRQGGKYVQKRDVFR